MRIISGIYGKRRFSVPKNFRARPTTDFAKENIFNVLENQVDWEETEALDLFAGTGSIGLEFVSRGCLRVICIEKSPVHYAFIKKVADELKTENFYPVKGDVFTYLNNTSSRFDLIFADPPYDLQELTELPGLIFSKGLLKENGIFILEHPGKYSFKDHPAYKEQRVYGSVNFTIFENKE
ncbi:MAG: RsmD family RNA methyltransferase [Candidatus Azobacteroides sp.]|nr:RsmD family RNA methyltransferase [Candidatus Azobacteroides sp.]